MAQTPDNSNDHHLVYIGPESDLVDAYAIDNPQSLLISPNGKLLARGFARKELPALIEKSLAEEN